MAKLDPVQAINVARGIYDVLYTNQLTDSFSQSINDNFNISSAKQFNGKSGFTLWQTTSGFGLATMGKSQMFKDDALIAIRGTKLGIDWVTDAHAGTGISNGKLVHSGFNKVFRSFQNDITAFFRTHHPQRVHCVGHSLGGAAATLVAEWIKRNTTAEPILYTFGSPRVGDGGYAQNFTSAVKRENIFRVYHYNDIVSMVPIWPFEHVPLPGNNFGVDFNGSSSILSPSAHYKENYQASMVNQSWERLQMPVMRATHESEIEMWLESTNTAFGRLTVNYIHFYEDSIKYILKKALLLAGISIQASIMNASNMLDLWAMAMAKGAEISQELAELLISLLSKMLAAVGMVIDKTRKMTAEYVRWVFQQLADAIYNMARQAYYNSLLY